MTVKTPFFGLFFAPKALAGVKIPLLPWFSKFRLDKKAVPGISWIDYLY
jgi:hypothetical protein